MNPATEWLEADGLGGFASGTVSGARTRRYHALLLAARRPPTERFVLVNGFDAWVHTPGGSVALSSQLYAPGVRHPDGAERLERFEPDPWPRWRFRLPDGGLLEQEVFVPAGAPVVVVAWRLAGARPGTVLEMRPFLSGRDYHALQRENAAFRFVPAMLHGQRLKWQAYPDVPPVTVLTNGDYRHAPEWYRQFLYLEEQARGLDAIEDLASPGSFRWDLGSGEAVWIAAADGSEALLPAEPPRETASILRDRERARRRAFPDRLHRAADAYLVRRGAGRTIVAGYPWFTDWGRDTFIALRGICLAAGRLDEARDILVEWAGAVSEGMLPNRFPDHGEAPEFNAVDAALWYVIAVHDWYAACKQRRRAVPAADRRTLDAACTAIIEGYARGTRFGIRLDTDGLIAAGEPGVQLTWMDAKVGDWVVTPRIGKPVEIQALWLNALRLAAPERKAELEQGLASFQARFWNEAGGSLHDVVDVDHRPGTVDPAFRPNQILAVGGLPLALLERERARRVVDEVERRLLTPLGLRSLAPGEPGYSPHYEGGVRERDGAYHQGTVWPWLIGPFVEAWLHVRGNASTDRREARERFLTPLLRHLDEAGLGHLSEIVDAEPPQAPRGCPFQAWSVGEALRLAALLGETRA